MLVKLHIYFSLYSDENFLQSFYWFLVEINKIYMCILNGFPEHVIPNIRFRTSNWIMRLRTKLRVQSNIRCYHKQYTNIRIYRSAFDIYANYYNIYVYRHNSKSVCLS